MRTFAVLAISLVAFLTLAACGGGGGGGGAKFPITNLTPLLEMETPYTLEAEITPSDVHAPDGSYLDFYKITPPAEVAINIEMRSDVIDSYLLLFTDDCVGKADLEDWEPCLLAFEDDLGSGPEDAMLGYILQPGQGYIVAANSYYAEDFGPYTLIVNMSPAARAPVR